GGVLDLGGGVRRDIGAQRGGNLRGAHAEALQRRDALVHPQQDRTAREIGREVRLQHAAVVRCRGVTDQRRDRVAPLRPLTGRVEPGLLRRRRRDGAADDGRQRRRAERQDVAGVDQIDQLLVAGVVGGGGEGEREGRQIEQAERRRRIQEE